VATIESIGSSTRIEALRCRIILDAVAGEQNVAIAEKLRVSRPTGNCYDLANAEHELGDQFASG
jgi:hypothetical protein